MDEGFYKMWFAGLSEGMESLDDQSKGVLLKCCAKRCADSGILNQYKEHYKKVNQDRDAFYARIHEMGGARGEVVVPGKEYYLFFLQCYCDLHTTGGVNTPALCECSRQSIIYVGQQIFGDVPFQVEEMQTVLGGGKECQFKITF